MKSIIKAVYNDNRVILADVVPLTAPFSIFIESSSRCNFKCNYCGHSLSNQKLLEKKFIKKNMDWEIFTDIISQIENFKERIKLIYLYRNGEPLLNRNLPRMVSYIKGKNITDKVGIITNGALFTPDLSKSLIDSGIDYIKISLQGMNSKKYKDVCGVNIDFNDFVNNIRYLYQIKNQCEIYVKIADIALDEGDKELFLSTFGDIADRIFIDTIRPLLHEIDYQSLGVNTQKIISMFGHVHNPQTVCPMPFFQLHITSSGDILPCCHFQDPTNFGNIKNISLKEVWNSEKYRNFINMQLSKERNRQTDYPVCVGCEFADINYKPEDELDSRAEEILRKNSNY